MSGARLCHDTGVEPIGAEDLFAIIDELREYVSVHTPVFDESGLIIDARLHTWNRAYARVRMRPVVLGQLMMEEYHDPLDAMGYVNRAWNEGSVQQVFEYTPETRDIYSPDRPFVFLNVLWQRVGDFVVEVGTDFSELRGMELDLENQRLAVIEASRARTMAQQREQIARDLHDSTVQQLFAACLFIESMVKTLDTDTTDTAKHVVSLLAGVIEEIRREVLDLRSVTPSVIEVELRDALRPIVDATGVLCTVVVEGAGECDPEIRSSMRAVVREAVSNAVRHGDAQSVLVTVTLDENRAELMIADDGNGFDTDATFSVGILDIRARAEKLHGEAEFFSTTRGTTIKWRVPLR